MARAIWKGAIAFGLVNIPVEVYSAEDRKEFKFSMLDKRDFSPVGYKRYNKRSGKEVEWGNIIKGYEYEKEKYVVLSEEDFRRANVKASRTIEIQGFVPAADIPAQFFETPYFLAPAPRGEKPYALLRETLRASGRVGVAQFVMRSTQHLAAITVDGKAMLLVTLRYPDEMRDASGLDLPSEGLKGAGVTPKEAELAKRLIEDMTEKWKPGEFKNTYHQDLMRRIKEKIKNGETRTITEPEAEEPAEKRSAEVIDLAAMLKKSLEGGTHDDAQSARKAEKPRLQMVHSSAARKTPVKRKRA